LSAPVALVVRSGARPVAAGSPPPGLEIEEFASHAIEAAPPPAPPSECDLAVFTSQTAVELGLAGRGTEGLRRAVAAAARIAAVGPATATALRAQGFAVDVVGAGSARDLIESLGSDLSGARVILPVGDDASRSFPAELERRGARVTRLVVYVKRALAPDPELAERIAARRYASFFPTSPAAVRWLFRGSNQAAQDILRETAAVALGPSTRAALLRRGVGRVSVAPEARFSAALRLLAALATPGSEK
jgi:uroporphyrinogen-III synthase